MACHSTPQVAPATMLKVYGDKNGFGWNMNETVGIQVVQVPMYFPLEKALQTFYTVMAALLGSFVLLFVALNLSLSSLVIEPMARLNRKLEDLATKDFLTDLVNRRRFFERLEAEMAETRINKSSLSVVMFDIDFFKRINDTYGHDSGDIVLKSPHCDRAVRCRGPCERQLRRGHLEPRGRCACADQARRHRPVRGQVERSQLRGAGARGGLMVAIGLATALSGRGNRRLASVARLRLTSAPCVQPPRRAQQE